VAGEDMVDAPHLAQGGVEGVDGGAGHPEGDLDAFLPEHVNGGFCSGHAGHDGILQ